MTLCTTTNILLGKNISTGYVSTFILSALLTTMFRISLLGSSLYLGGNSIVVRLFPPAYIPGNTTCPAITILSSSTTFLTYQQAGQDLEQVMTQLSMQDKHMVETIAYSGGELYYEEEGERYLAGYGESWVTVYNNSVVIQPSYYYYYCQDISYYLNTVWLPVMSWVVVTILPLIFLSIIVLLIVLKTRCIKTTCFNPGLVFSSVFSHLQVGPVHYCHRNFGYLCLSKHFSNLNIFISFISLVIHLHLNTAQFDPEESTTTITYLICVPFFLMSSSLAISFLHCVCCKVHTDKYVFNPDQPSSLYIINHKHKVVPEEEETEV